MVNFEHEQKIQNSRLRSDPRTKRSAWREALPPNHLARFVVDVIAQLDLSRFMHAMRPLGGKPLRRKSCWGCCSMAMPPACSVRARSNRPPTRAFRFGSSPVDCIPTMTRLPTFARPFWRRSKSCSCKSCSWRRRRGCLKLGNISLDGSKIHADASKSNAVSYKRLIELEAQLRQEVHELLDVGRASRSRRTAAA